MTNVVRNLMVLVMACACCLLASCGLFVLGGCVQRAISAETDSRIKVAVIDTGLDLKDPRFKDVLCKTGHQDFTGTSLADTHGHGTHIAGIIASAPFHEQFCLIIMKYYVESASGMQNMNRERAAVAAALILGARFVNISGGGDVADAVERMMMADNPNTTFIVAAGNNGEDYTNKYYPAAYKLKNVIPVGNLDCDRNGKGSPARTSNFGPGVIWRCGMNIKSTLPGGKRGWMSGTSQAAAVTTASILNAIGKARQ